ncbi:MAG: carboxypeptidase regulatory-like domain-containing protein, partial [Candidatus Electrothrix sp. AR5]|nr:carboxypeptidase regulatory-like domain-containing protein [Candidatus Electrothrix sp. AR5]
MTNILKNSFAVFFCIIITSGNAFAWKGDTWKPLDRSSIESTANSMMKVSWTPSETIRNWRVGAYWTTFKKGTYYKGVAYSQNNPQEDLAEFKAKIKSTKGGNTGYGNDCSGFVSISWRLPTRYATSHFEADAIKSGGYVSSLGAIGTGKSANLKTGDALNRSRNHIVLFKNRTASGINTMEQTPITARSKQWTWSNLKKYRPIRRNNLQETDKETNNKTTGNIYGYLHVDSKTGKKLSGVTVTCDGKKTSTSKSGRYYLKGITANKRHNIRFSKPGYHSYTAKNVYVRPKRNNNAGHRYLIRKNSKKLSYVYISGQSKVNENSSASYKLIAKFTNGSRQYVTGSSKWTDNSRYVSFSSKGKLKTASVNSNKSAYIYGQYTYGGVTRKAQKRITVVNKKSAKKLSYISISGPSSVNEKSSASYTLTAKFSDGSRQYVTSSSKWTDNSRYVSFSSKGKLKTTSVSSNKSAHIYGQYTYGGVTKKAQKKITVVKKKSAKKLSYISISGPSSVNEKSSANYTLIAKFTDGSTRNVTGSAKWKESSSYITSVSGGKLIARSVSSNKTGKIYVEYTYNGVRKKVSKSVRILNRSSSGSSTSTGSVYGYLHINSKYGWPLSGATVTCGG